MGEIQSYTSIDVHSIFLGNINEKIYSFLELPEGWDYGMGVAASNETAELAQTIVSIGQAKNFLVDAFPATDGGIVLNLYVEDNFIYITISPSGSLDLRYEKGIGENYEILQDLENLSLDEINDHLNILFNQCFLFEPYISRNTIKTQSDLPVRTSRIMMGEFQFSSRNAPFGRAGQYVTT